MLMIKQITKGDKKNIFLCVRGKEDLIHSENNTTDALNRDNIVADEKTSSCEENLICNGKDKNVNLLTFDRENEVLCHDISLQLDNSTNDLLTENNKSDINNTVNLKEDLELETQEKIHDSLPDSVSSVKNQQKLENSNCKAYEDLESNTWDDYVCYKISQEDFFPSKAMDLNKQKLIVTRFLDFYVGGRVPKGLCASDLLFAVISITPLTADTEELIWYENEYKDDGTLFFLTPEEKLNAEYKSIVAKANQTHASSLKNNYKLNSTGYTHVKTHDNDIISKSVIPNKGLDSVDVSSKTNLCSVDNKDMLSSFITNLTSHMSINWHGSVDFGNTSIQQQKTFGPSENSAFITSCNKLLQSWDESNNCRIILKYFFGIVALTLLRGIVKGKNNIINTFKSEKFINKFSFMKHEISYSPPHENCVEKCCREMKMRERHHRIMFAKLLLNAFRIDFLYKMDLLTPCNGLYNIFRMCVVDHVVNYDMGIINLLKTIYRYVGPGTHFSIIIEELQSKEIDYCLEHVRRYILKYLVKNEKTTCLTHHWARYFDPTKFEYLSCNSSYATAVVLAVFVEKLSFNTGVWRSGWVKTQQDDLDKYKQLANQLYEDYKRQSAVRSQLCQQFFSSKLQYE